MLKNCRLAIAPINWTNDDMPQLGGDRTFEQMISEAALAGYQGTEIGGKFPTDPVILKKALDLRGLCITSQWFSSFLCSESYASNEERFIAQLDFLEQLGAKMINVCELTRCLFAETCSMFDPVNKPVATDGEWEALCTGLNRLGKLAAGRGFKLCYHHHMATVVQTLEETKRLMDNTDPAYVSLVFDTGHFQFAGEDPVAAAKCFADRIAYVHLKDIRKEKMEQAYREGFAFRQSVLEGCFTVPGDGCIDYPAVFAMLEEAGFEGWMEVEAEQDPDIANPFEYALKARKYLEKVMRKSVENRYKNN